ncbi:MAG: HAD family phosphatase [Phycisphaerae bacterium]|jgi:HAD superfamily hydrolase (TIGR01484 family)|nr:HAD family phosphatase [Phycisphaerae bacterium]
MVTRPRSIPRLLVVDLDGTLLNRQGRVSAANAEAVRRAEAAGVEVVVATGRSWLESRDALEAIGHAGVFIGAGGAVLHDSRSGRILTRRTVDTHLVESIAESIIRHGHLAHMLQDPNETGADYVLVGDARLDAASEWWFRVHPLTVRTFATLAEARPFGATIRVGTVAVGAELAELAHVIREDVGDRIMLQHWPALTEHEVTGSATHLLECFAPETDKWTMTLALCRDRGFRADEVAAVGDGLNDRRLIAECGFGIAMANADERVTKVAKAHVGHHDEDGFAEAVTLLLEGVVP